MKNQQTSVGKLRDGRLPFKVAEAVDLEVQGLLDTLSGVELVEAVIDCVHRYALEEFDDLDSIAKCLRFHVWPHMSSFISDEHREFIARCHARGLSTSDAVLELIQTDEAMSLLSGAGGLKELREDLVHRLAYLKPGRARWPENKYGWAWREERERYKREISDIPFTSQVEQVSVLAKQADRISRELENETHSLEDLQSLTTLLVKVMESMRKLSVVEEPMPVDLSGLQLVGVLERLTLALKAPEEKAELVGMLEQLTLALKAPEHKADGSETKALPAAREGDEGKPE